METNRPSTVLVAETTKSGLVSLWEKGGGYSNTGDAQIICRPDGGKPTAVYICRRGQLAGAEHALVPVQKGYFLIVSSHHRGDFNHKIYKVLRTFSEDNRKKVELSLVNSFDRGEWDTPLPEELKAAVDAAEAKASTYHCRYPLYVVEKKKNEK